MMVFQTAQIMESRVNVCSCSVGSFCTWGLLFSVFPIPYNVHILWTLQETVVCFFFFFWFLSFVLGFSSLPLGLLDLLSLSRPLWPLPGSHKAAAERTMCAQLWAGLLSSRWCLSRYGNPEVGLYRIKEIDSGVYSAAESQYCYRRGHNAGK